MQALLANLKTRNFFAKKEQRSVQATFLPVLTVQFTEQDELETTDRGDHGFGSTGL